MGTQVGALRPGDPDFGWEFHAEDFVYARLVAERTAAEALTNEGERERAMNRIDSLRLAVAIHCAYVDQDGWSRARCYTCASTEGFPCSTMRYFTRMWRHHPDYVPGWNDTLDGSGEPSWWQQDMLRIARAGGFRNDFLAKQAQEQTPPVEGDQVA